MELMNYIEYVFRPKNENKNKKIWKKHINKSFVKKSRIKYIENAENEKF